MNRHIWLSYLAFLALVIGCGPKVPIPPPEFDLKLRAATGDNRLEGRILEQIRLTELQGEDWELLHNKVRSGRENELELSNYITVLILRNELGEALNHLHQRAISRLGDESLIADSLGLAMGQRRWRACKQMTNDYLSRKAIAGAFLIRGLCSARSGDLEAMDADYNKANALLPLGDELLAKLSTISRKRSAPTPMRPADKKIYGELMSAMLQRGPLARLFVQHLLNRFESSLHTGSLELGSLSAGDIRQVILSRSRSYRQCYAMARARRPYRPLLNGGVTLEFMIEANGSLNDVTVSKDNWSGHHAAGYMNDCLSEQLEALRFPGPRQLMRQRAQHHFSFSQ